MCEWSSDFPVRLFLLLIAYVATTAFDEKVQEVVWVQKVSLGLLVSRYPVVVVRTPEGAYSVAERRLVAILVRDHLSQCSAKKGSEAGRRERARLLAAASKASTEGRREVASFACYRRWPVWRL